jgi:hypothetical protein
MGDQSDCKPAISLRLQIQRLLLADFVEKFGAGVGRRKAAAFD